MVSEKWALWTYEQRFKFLYARDKFSRSSARRRLLLKTTSEPPLPTENASLSSSARASVLPNGLTERELKPIAPRPGKPGRAHVADSLLVMNEPQAGADEAVAVEAEESGSGGSSSSRA